MTDTTEIKILKKPAVRSKCAIASDQHLHQLVRAGRFPAPINLGCRSVGWIEAEIDSWLRARIAERDARLAGATHQQRVAERDGRVVESAPAAEHEDVAMPMRSTRQLAEPAMAPA